MRLVHIINPVKVGPKSDLFVAQPVTFETMHRAKLYASNHVEVDLLATCYPEDEEIVPSYFSKTSFLDRSVLDMGEFKIKRKLPLISDILYRAIEHDPDADYVIYTNVDIALQPYFYQFVNKQIDLGYDAFVINRRTIPATHNLDSLEEAYSEVGMKHPGFDCFVFKNELFNEMKLDEICIGTTRIGLALISNLIVLSKNFTIFTDKHLTFHIGEDRIWQDEKFEDYVRHNEKNVIRILQYFKYNFNSKFISSELLLWHLEKLTSKYQTVKERKNQSKWYQRFRKL